MNYEIKFVSVLSDQTMYILTNHKHVFYCTDINYSKIKMYGCWKKLHIHLMYAVTKIVYLLNGTNTLH
jgi:hypothetical protein